MLLSYMNYYNETRTHLSLEKDAPYRARFREQGVFFAFQSWAGCITNMFGFDLRQAQVFAMPDSQNMMLLSDDGTGKCKNAG